MTQDRLRRERVEGPERVRAASAPTRDIDRLLDLQRAVGNRAFGQAVRGHVARSPSSDKLEKFYERVIAKSPGSGEGYAGLLVNLNELFDTSRDPDPDMGAAVVRIIKRLTGLAYQDWFHAGPDEKKKGGKSKEEVSAKVLGYLNAADYSKLNSQLAAEIMEPITTLRTSFHPGGGDGFQKEVEWGTAIVTQHAAKLSSA